MSEFISKIIEQSPFLGGLVLIVWMFLKHLKDSNKSNINQLKEQNDFIRQLNDENIEARKHSRDVIEKNTEALGKNTEALRELAVVSIRKK